MKKYYPSFEKFCELLADGVNTVPVYCQLLSDNFTPVTAYAHLSKDSQYSFLLESVVGGEKIARYSFLSADPVAVFKAYGREVEISRQGQVTKLTSDDPLRALEDMLKPYRPARLAGLPPFLGGLVGYAGYDVVRYYEDLPNAPQDDRKLPDLLFGLYQTMVLFDHVNKTIKVVCNAHVESGQEPIDAYKQACSRVQQLVEKLSEPVLISAGMIDTAGSPTVEYASNFQREKFMQAVDRCKEYILAGDIIQVVLSQRLSVEVTADDFDIYRALRVVNPSPFMFHLKSPHCVLVGSSPEIMCSVEDGIITNRPLAGTRPRGATEQEDRALAEDLLADPKERAEHIMLVDLGRNDVGRVAQLGSVKLTDVMTIEHYSHVMHISSNVQGKLADGKNAFDALRATLPVGTVSGAPKVRAMQIIDEFEPTRRGPYAGAVGYVDFSGNMSTCIALRTFVITSVSFTEPN